MSEEDFSYFRSESERRAGVLIWQVFPPFLIIFGTIGNVLSIIILTKARFNRYASSVYLVGLAMADLSILYIGLLRQWVKYLFDQDIRFTSSAMCKIHWWLMYSNADICVWILPAITVERLISTLCPTKSKTICTNHRAKLVLLILLVTALSINSHILYGFGRLEIEADNETIIIPCAPLTESYGHFFGKIWTWIDLCKFSLIPFAILSLGNVCIIWKVLQSTRKTKRQVGPASSNVDKTAERKTFAMSKLLVALNFVFIACTAPVCIYFIGEPYWIPKEVPRDIQLQDPWWAFVNMLMYINNTANFVLYCVSGSRFRQELVKLFTKERVTGIRTTTSILPNSLHL